KAVILAAGEGSRLYPFSTQENPKVLLPFLGRPLFFYHIDEFLSQGIRDFVFVCNQENQKKIQDLCKKNYPTLGASFVTQKKLLGPAHAVYSARSELADSDFFILKYADSLMQSSALPFLLDHFKKDPQDGAILLFAVSDFKRFGIARFRNGKLAEIVEKPQKNPPSNLAWRGLSILSSKKFLQGFRKETLDPRATEVPTPEYVLRAGGILNYKIVNFKNFDLGYPWDILTYNRVLIDQFGGKILTKKIGKNVKISSKSYIDSKTVLGDNVQIGDYVSLENAHIGANTVIRDSYIMPGAKIGKNCKILKTVIGQDVSIGDNFQTRIKAKNKIKVWSKGEYKETAFSSLGCFLGPKVKVADKITAEPGKIVYPGKEVNKNIVHDIFPIRAIFFDADNTLYPTRKAAPQADKKAMAYLAQGSIYSAAQLYHSWLRKIVARIKESKDPRKRSRLYSYQKLAQKYALKQDYQKAYLIFRDVLAKVMKPYPYVLPVLKELKNYIKVVVSEDNQDLIQYKLQKLGLRPYFDLVVSAEDAGVMKPSNKYFNSALEKLKLHPEECVMIGDDWKKDLEPAAALGMRTIKWGEEDSRAHRNIKNFRQLPKILEII
ncbi:MAG: HAD-IA family hydrolase, partial [bacterium]|nr:HAD-IA family hydrolase [bacterium]